MDSVRVGGWLILANLVRRHPGTRSVLSGCTASFDNLIFTLLSTNAGGGRPKTFVSRRRNHRTKENFGLLLVARRSLAERLRYFFHYLWNFIRTKEFAPYGLTGNRPENMHFTVPVFLGVLFWIGGYY